MYDIITIGAAVRDVFLRSAAWEVQKDPKSPTGLEQCFPLGAKVPVDDIVFATGGGATNAAATFAKLGKLRTAAICRIGTDFGGDLIRKEIKQLGVDTTLIQRDPKRNTGYSLILLSGAGQRTILVHRGASAHLSEKELSWRRMKTKWFYITSLGGNLALMRRVFTHAAANGALVAWNPGSSELAHGAKKLRPLLKEATVLSLNSEEAAALTDLPTRNVRGMLRSLSTTYGIPYVLITDGARGAYLRAGNTTWFAKTRPVKAVNVTGAGDAFGSAFVAGLALEENAPNALCLGMANAEGVIREMGAKNGILTAVPPPTRLAKQFALQQIRL
ncbi:MAG: carbohydrate kinase family protein [Candidatus Uhrbacteria bacterium]